MITPKARHLYYGYGTGGLILSPATTTLFCAYPEDGNSMAKTCQTLGGDGTRCIPGCYPKGQQCPDVGHAWSCSFPPSALREALQAQEDRIDFLSRNNELVVDLRSVTGRLPDSIEGFFFFKDSGPAERSKATSVRRAFLAEYGLSEEAGPPIVVVDLQGGGDAPFSLAT